MCTHSFHQQIEEALHTLGKLLQYFAGIKEEVQVALILAEKAPPPVH